MRNLSRRRTCLFNFALLGMLAASANAQKAAKLTWGPVPPFLPTGGQMAVVSGDPMKAGEFVLQLKMPAGYMIPAHMHSTDENVLVKSGTLRLGMGDAFDAKKLKSFKAGEKTTAVAKMNHFVRVSRPTVVELSGTGPFTITYVATGNSTVPAKGK